ncbi:D(2) dopamine receptor-like [Porites lutea]|uniref:D(2) dopamine receptor-like n=1 Tax=Porites lutea TaxID=51062 RepID=UPI003CC5A7D8
MPSNVTDSNSAFVETITWCLVFSIEALFGIVVNLVTIAAFLNKKTPLQKQSSPLLTNLAFADLLVATIVIPGWVYYIGDSQEWVYSPVVSIGYSTIDILTAFASVTNHGCIAVERLLATLSPMKYMHNKRKITSYLIAFPWVCAILISSLVQVGFHVFHSPMIAFFAWLPFLLALLLVVTLSYLILLCRIRQISKNLSNSSERSRRRSQRFTVTAFIVTVVSFTAWLPFMIMSAINLFVEINDDARIVNPVKLLHFFNSLGNPIIYWLRLPHFKVSVYELLSRCRPKTQADYSVQIMNGFVTTRL